MATDVEALLAQIAATPDDDAPYLVLADVLQQRGDPRGELIAVQSAKPPATGEQLCELWRRDIEIVEANGEWLRPVRDHAHRLTVRWRNGFPSALRIRGGLVKTWKAMLATPLVRETLTELHIDAEAWRHHETVDAVAAARPPALRRLVLGAAYWDRTTAVPFDLSPLAALALDELTCAGQVVTIGRATWPTLQRLELRAPALSFGELARVARWPKLRSLVLWIREPTDLAKVITRARFPALRELGLVGTEATAGVARSLAKLPIVEQLERVDLRGGTLDHAAPVAALADRVAVDVRLNTLTKPEANKLRNPGPQRDGGAPLAAPEGPSELERVAQH